MAATMDPKGGFKQDMVVSTRYRNDLPPPPMPPKLLEIDNGGLAQFLTTSFAAGMARREEPNIEVDAEGGMPIDMIGIPGYFLGDESAIMAPEIQPVLDPADHALMLTPDQLRNQNSKNVNVSFLRKTQYMSAQNARANDGFIQSKSRTSRITGKSASATDPQTLPRDDPTNIKRHVLKGFDIAYPETAARTPRALASQPTATELSAWRTPTHPDDSALTPVAFYPILPDLEAQTDGNTSAGGFTSLKFDKPPISALGSHRDPRTDVAFINIEDVDSALPAWQAKFDAHTKNPELYAAPGPRPMIWHFAIPRVVSAVAGIKRKFNDTDPDKNDDALYGGLAEHVLPYPAMEYERKHSYTNVGMDDVSGGRMIALSLFDADSAGIPEQSRLRSRGAAAYYYPINTRAKIRPEKAKVGVDKWGGMDEREQGELEFDGITLQVRDADAYEMYMRACWRRDVDPVWQREVDKWEERAKSEFPERFRQEEEDMEEGAEEVDRLDQGEWDGGEGGNERAEEAGGAAG